ncbi:hypothetical protein H2200_007339 [Cladophialophora chaetospira]|uniref:Uncharacterized protein n=1 Tax=Cladophialophora chaetospira TaxID=386627 RepID=A0AA39CH04_9EURO|nr:hypothetical protein H2200_007339 [Cladophialophora chaetospira]
MLGLENLYIPGRASAKQSASKAHSSAVSSNRHSVYNESRSAQGPTFEPPSVDFERIVRELERRREYSQSIEKRLPDFEKSLQDSEKELRDLEKRLRDFGRRLRDNIDERAQELPRLLSHYCPDCDEQNAPARTVPTPVDVGLIARDDARSLQRLVLPAIMNGIACDALPDTMSTANIMTKAHAISIGAAIDPDARKRSQFTNACGTSFDALGEVVVDVTFPSEPCKIWRGCRFAVVEKCAAAVIFGDAFLRATETLTKFRSRLKKTSAYLPRKLWRICYMDAPLRQLSCAIDHRSVRANADTGSDVDLVSAEYAKSRAWRIQPLPEDTGHVILADETVRKVAGCVEVPLTVANTTISNTFYVLDGLVCDVLLGDGTLEMLDVFNRYEDHFVDTNLNVENGICHNINWQKTVDRRLEQILQDDFPSRTAAELGGARFNRIGLNLVSSEKNARAWKEAFDRAIHLLDDREVTAQVRSQRAMVKQLKGNELEHARRQELERKEKHRRKAERIKQERNRFLGIGPSTT